MELYHVLVNEKGQAVFAQREEWGKYSVCMHALMTNDVKSMPGHQNVYYSFWNPANPVMELEEGHILFFLEAESLIEAINKVGPIWWEIGDMRLLRKTILPHNSSYTTVSSTRLSGIYQKAAPPPIRRKVSAR